MTESSCGKIVSSLYLCPGIRLPPCDDSDVCHPRLPMGFRFVVAPWWDRLEAVIQCCLFWEFWKTWGVASLLVPASVWGMQLVPILPKVKLKALPRLQQRTAPGVRRDVYEEMWRWLITILTRRASWKVT